MRTSPVYPGVSSSQAVQQADHSHLRYPHRLLSDVEALSVEGGSLSECDGTQALVVEKEGSLVEEPSLRRDESHLGLSS